ncbi:hypothetical protein M5D96_006843 [Drosophila gunungcola]|uniref:Peptidoglycan recognition protein family domain-containing protein n=1 Tax=Drosophila gunungcola TaxID=103775 RepID=A0A9P9YPQ0_9MUSC|nr:hypothetical protein M5D96_006843 [Drosophila gunungcola]
MDSSHIAVRMARSPSPSGASQSSYGSFGSIEDIVHIRVDEDCGVNESTPLLAATQRTNKSPPSSPAFTTSPSPRSRVLTKDCLNWQSVVFLVMCASALGLASYLLWRQKIKRLNHFALLAAQMADLGYRLSLIEHDIWSEMDLQGRGTPLDATNVFTVLFTHTESEECREDCPEVLHKLQSSLLAELPYNFLITGDCQAYMIYGWEYQSDFSKDLPGGSYLVIAFVGNFDRFSPSDCQLKAAQALILESLKRKKLQPDYELVVVGNHAEALQQELQHWPRYASHRRIK